MSFMEMNVNWSYPTDIRFGQGRLSELVALCEDIGLKKPLFVTDKSLFDKQFTKEILSNLKKNTLLGGIFLGVEPNPNELNLMAGIRTFKAGEHDGIIAFGGGSVLDVGKLIAFMSSQSRPVWDFEDIGDWWKRADESKINPIIAIPTTAGTGSEVGRASVLTNSKTVEKKIIFHPKMLPSIVICDPNVTMEMPKKITAGTGMDAFAHCLEAYCSPNFHPMSQGIAIEGMRLIKENLLIAYRDGNNKVARSSMMAAALMGATAFQKGLGAVHALSHPIGAIYNCHHGTTNAVLIPAVLKMNREKIEKKIEMLANYLDINNGFDGFLEFMIKMNKSLEIPDNLTSLGVSSLDFDSIIKKALVDPSANGNPVRLTDHNLRELMTSCLK